MSEAEISSPVLEMISLHSAFRSLLGRVTVQGGFGDCKLLLCARIKEFKMICHEYYYADLPLLTTVKEVMLSNDNAV